ncbi:MAG TPA: polymer-forming cytoskeletal protein [bacterium]|nr:polymer-forming cytoskeletal protein [bacterium]HPT29504.1 polymer-forming cytoskeletal protein [bacterium]
MSKTKLFLAIFSLGLISLAPIATLAYSVRSESSIYIPKEQAVEGNLYAAASSLVIDGNVYGDVIAAAENITINGEVNGDVIGVASNITVNGPVSGSIRVLGENLNFNNAVNRNINALGNVVILGNNSKVGGDVLAASGALESRGQINGSLHGVSDRWVIAGTVLQNVDARISNPEGTVTLVDSAKVSGSFKYMSLKEGGINSSLVEGEVIRLVPKDKGWQAGPYFLHRLYGLLSSLLVALVILSLWPRQIRKIAVVEKNKLGWQALIGLAALFLTPFVCFLLLFTFIGWPLALILGVLWLVAIYLAKIWVGISLGAWIFQKLKKAPTKKGLSEMALGLLALWILLAIPFVGMAVSFLAICWGLGMIVGSIKINR